MQKNWAIEQNFRRILPETIEERTNENFFSDLQSLCRERDTANRCAPYEKLRIKYESLYGQYADSFDELNLGVEGCASERRYSSGGMNMHRGLYSPSRLDMVDGKLKRGALLKKSRRLKNYSFEYLFDQFGRMNCVHCFGKRNLERVFLSSELFELTSDGSRGFVFDKYNGNRLVRISECRYSEVSNELMRYESAVFTAAGCVEINVEIPFYENELLAGFLWYRYYPKFLLLDHVKYSFARDKDGELTSFISEKYNGTKKSVSLPMPICNKSDNTANQFTHIRTIQV